MVAGGIAEAPPLSGVERQRLLHEDVLAGLDRRERVGQVAVVHGRDIDDVDLGVRQHVAAAETPRHAHPLREGPRSRGIARLDGDDLLVRVGL